MINKPENLKDKTNISAWIEKSIFGNSRTTSLVQNHNIVHFVIDVKISFIDVQIMKYIHIEKASEEEKYEYLFISSFLFNTSFYLQYKFKILLMDVTA